MFWHFMNKQSLLLWEAPPPAGKQLGRQLPYIIASHCGGRSGSTRPNLKGPLRLTWRVGVTSMFFFFFLWGSSVFVFCRNLFVCLFRYLSRVCLGRDLFSGIWDTLLGKMPFPRSALCPQAPTSVCPFYPLELRRVAKAGTFLFLSHIPLVPLGSPMGTQG